MNSQEPLDPEVEFIRKKMIRLLIISSLVMIVGLLAVFFGIIYKVNGTFETVNSQGVIKLPSDSRIIETSVDGGVVMFRVEESGATIHSDL